MSELSEASRTIGISAPEQFLAVRSLLQAAAEANRSADMNDDYDDALASLLRTAATGAHGAARALLASIAPDDAIDAAFAELEHLARV